jgi:hypothetical protein
LLPAPAPPAPAAVPAPALPPAPAARLLMLSPRDTAGGRPPTAVPVVVDCMLVARRLLLVGLLLLPGPGPASERAGLRAHAGIRSSGLLPCKTVECHQHMPAGLFSSRPERRITSTGSGVKGAPLCSTAQDMPCQTQRLHTCCCCFCATRQVSCITDANSTVPFGC